MCEIGVSASLIVSLFNTVKCNILGQGWCEGVAMFVCLFSVLIFWSMV